MSSIPGQPGRNGRTQGGVAPLLWWLAYVAFVIYGSLVPLNFQPRPWDEAWAAFQHIRLLDVGAGGRGDWVANGVLYVPVGLLTAMVLGGGGSRRLPWWALAASLGFATTLALAVEYVQLYFPPRTVSLNDVVAELIGSALGVVLAANWADRLGTFLAVLAGSPERLAGRLLKAYVIAYCAFSLFPYDFLVSGAELAAKLHSGKWGWLLAGEGRGGAVAAFAKSVAEALATVPLGWIAVRYLRGAGLGTALALGAGLGVLVEVGQFFIVSGVSQGISVLTRVAGMGAGALLWLHRDRLDLLRMAAALRRGMVPAVLLYGLALVAVNGWFEHPWRGFGPAAQALAETRFLPFYYHYYTTEQAALLSLTSVCLMYGPIGILTWASFSTPGLALCLAALAAGAMEASKLFLVGLHADPTNLLLAGIAAWGVACLADRLALAVASRGGAPAGRPASAASTAALRVAAVPDRDAALAREDSQGQPQTAVPASPSGATSAGQGSAAAQGRSRPSPVEWAGAALALAAATWGVLAFPLLPGLLSLILAGYGALLWRRPEAMLVAIPAAVALLNLAPWSGRLYFDEFDMLVLVSLAVGYLRLAPAPRGGRRDPLFLAAAVLLGLAYGIGCLRGLTPWQMPDANAFSNYHSPYNALRVAKGALWAFLLYGLIGRMAAAGADVRGLFGRGMVLGLAGTVAVVVWERAAFPGLFNFSDMYRVTGPFADMHTGEADIEAYLVAAVPFLVLLMVEQRHWPARLMSIGLLTGASYAVMVTFSRAGFVGFGLALVVALAVAVPGRSGWRQRGLMMAVALAASLAAVLPILSGTFAQERLSRVSADLAVRMAHWRDALEIRDPGLATSMLGMGLGRFPETHYWRSAEQRAASYRLIRDDDKTFLRLGSGSPLYLEQGVPVQPGRDYVLTLQGRGPKGDAQVSVSLCEKWLLTSARCVFRALAVPPGGNWQTLRVTLSSGELGNTRWYAPRPVKLSLFSGARNAVVDVANISLAGSDGVELLTNGDFADGMDRWFFTVDVYLPWHISSVPVTMLFELGWFGVLAVSGLFALALGRCARLTWTGDPAAGVILAALLGWAVLGAVDSIMDSPRMLFLILLVAGLGARGRGDSERPWLGYRLATTGRRESFRRP